MSSSNDISEDIIQCAQEICNQIVSSHSDKENANSMSNAAQLFLKTLQTNIATAINIIYFNEDGKENGANGSELNKDDLELERAIIEINSKRRRGTKVCTEVLEKTLSISRKTLMALEVAPDCVSVEKFAKPPASCQKEDLKRGAKKTAERLNNTVKYASELSDFTEELVKAAVIYKDLNGTGSHDSHLD